MSNIPYDSQEEAELAQINNLQRNSQAIDLLRLQLQRQQSRPSLENCDQCGDDIPLARQQAVPGVELCIHCQSKRERFKANYRLPDDR